MMRLMNKKYFYFLLLLSLSGLSGCSEKSPDSIVDVDDTQEIIGGKVVAAKDRLAYSTVFLLNLEFNSVCTGTLIARDVVLTAAHCVPKDVKDLEVFFARNPLAPQSQVVGHSLTEIHVHPRFNLGDTQKSIDLAVLMLEEQAPVVYRSVSLAPREAFTVGQNVWLAGYGQSSTVRDTGVGRLRKVRIPISFVDEDFIEVNQGRGKGICDGDSGGPVFVYYKKRLKLMGVSKMAYDKGNSGSENCLTTGQFTSLASQDIQDWIGNLLQKNLADKGK